MLKGKTIVLGVTGGIAAFKAAQLASDLVKTGAKVEVIMTRNATEFVTPLTFEAIIKRKVSVDTFDRNFEYHVEHIALAKKADLFLVAPATANVIAKMAAGIADDMLTTTILAANCPKLIAPAMNTGMYDNPITQRNLQTLRAYGMEIVEPETGMLACGDVGRGRLASGELLMEVVVRALTPKDMNGIRVLVTAGPTREAIDPVRFVSNHSTGLMGYALAQAASRRGAVVTLVSGKVALTAPMGVELIPVVSAAEMLDAVVSRCDDQQIIIKSAAVADYTPETVASDKMKKSGDGLTLPLKRTTDILAQLGHNRKAGQVICGFSMETKDLVENSRAKLVKKNVDMIVANNLKETGAGFGTVTNKVTILTPDETEALPLMTKEEVANAVLDRLLKKLNNEV